MVIRRHCYQIPLGFLFSSLFHIHRLPLYPGFSTSDHITRQSRSSLDSFGSLRGSRYHEILVAEEFQEIKESWSVDGESAKKLLCFLNPFRGIDLRRTLLSIAAVCLQAFSGTMFLLICDTSFLMSGSTKPFRDSIVLSCLSLPSTSPNE